MTPFPITYSVGCVSRRCNPAAGAQGHARCTFPGGGPLGAAKPCRGCPQGVKPQLARAAVVLVQGGCVALIRRERTGEPPYYLFPGGGVEEGETPAAAARREAQEELGLEVRLDGLLAVVLFRGRLQHFYRATAVGGRFGAGTGAEMTAEPQSPRGSHTPVWLPVADLPQLPVRPAALARALATRPGFQEPLTLIEEG
jgi:8-oxo-dGTP diphosphatase